MSEISNTIYDYYVTNFDRLPLDKQFHFASRLQIWLGDEQSQQLLQQLRPRLVPNDDASAALSAIADGTLIPLLPGNQALLHLRKIYNDRYPLLRSGARLLYWAALLDQMYDVDARSAVPTVLSEDGMHQMYEALLADDAAIATLSTHAVNFLYLYKKYYLQEAGPAPLHFSRMAANPALYDLADPLSVQLCMYLLTHVIIADSLFYAEPLSQASAASYAPLLSQLEAILTPRLESISLDSKLEFLACCRLAGFTTTLEDAILTEANQSMSPDGGFLVDRHNTSGSRYVSFEKSEHRSVLYIMATHKRGGGLKTQ